MQMGSAQLTSVETIGGDKAFLVGLLDLSMIGNGNHALRCPALSSSKIICDQSAGGVRPATTELRVVRTEDISTHVGNIQVGAINPAKLIIFTILTLKVCPSFGYVFVLFRSCIVGEALSYLQVRFSGPRSCGTTWKKAANGSAARTIS